MAPGFNFMESLAWTAQRTQEIRARELRQEKRDRWLYKILGVGFIVYLSVCGAAALYERTHSNLFPDFSVTPGAVRTVDKADVCGNRSTRQYRHWSRERDDRILRKYGLPPGPHPDFEIDHLIPLDLGGADDDANLWPQPRLAIEPNWNAERKDRLEFELGDLVCAGYVNLAEVQSEIRKDWIAAYRKYLGAYETDDESK